MGSRQLVEIAKAISQEASILILDEPTASLAAAEASTLMAAVRRLTAQGIAVIYISHHLSEVMDICDQVTVLRDGNVTLSVPTAETTLAAIIESMMGRSLESALTYQDHVVDRDGRALLRVTGLRNARLRDVSFDLHRGEIIGIAGLLGSGRSELMRAIFGVDRLDAGTIEVDGVPVRIRGPRDALDAGIALVPEDRARAGLVRDHSVGQNALMAAWRQFARSGFVDDGSARRAARGLVERLNIRTTGVDQPVKELSGGNQQKVVVARNLSVKPSVLLLDDPTVGVDVGSKREILMQVRSLATGGDGIILVSSEFEELSGVADRVLVIRDGARGGRPRSIDRRRPVRGGDLPSRSGTGGQAGIADVITHPIRLHTGGLNTMTSPMDPLRPAKPPVRSYETHFERDETPISEGGMWLNARTDGIDWCDVVTKGGVAFGEVTRPGEAERRAEQGNLEDADAAPVGIYDDPTAVLTGEWGKDQFVQARVFSRNQTDQYFQEVEIRLRTTIAPHRITGYEVFWRCLKTDEAYAEIVRWDGTIGSWKSLTRKVGPEFGVKDGDLVEACMVGNEIRGYINGVLVTSATDDTYEGGSPGVGYNFGVGDTNVDHGFTWFQADTYDG